MNPKVSVIIPVYNASSFLNRCLDSVLAQSVEDIEVICVNDKSTDNSLDILSDYATKNPERMRVINNDVNIGGGRSREKAIKEACGTFITFLDSDDYLATDFVETYLNVMRKENVDVVVGGFTKDYGNRLVEVPATRGPWGLTTYSISCAKMYRRDFLIENDIRYSPIKCGEDIYFGLDIFYHNATYTTIDYFGYYYYFNEQSTTNTMTSEQNMEKNVAAIFDQFSTNHDIKALSEADQDVIEYSYLANMINALIVYGIGCGIRSMRDKVDFFHSDLAKRFPSFRDNMYVGLTKPQGQSAKIRLAVGIFTGLHKIGLDRPLYYLASLL